MFSKWDHNKNYHCEDDNLLHYVWLKCLWLPGKDILKLSRNLLYCYLFCLHFDLVFINHNYHGCF